MVGNSRVRRELIRAMNIAGLRSDDAVLAADVSLVRLRRQRDALIRSARGAGLSYRQIALVFSMSHVHVRRVLLQGSSDVTPRRRTV